MELIVRAVDVGFGNTKFITGVAGSEIRFGCIPSLAYPSARDPATLPAAEPRWPGQIPPPLATPNSPRQDVQIMTTRG